MGNVPSESCMGDRLRCCKCDKVLPPCYTFDDFCKTYLRGQEMYVYNGGEYYRPVGHDNMYECEYCFNKPVRDQEKMRQEEQQRIQRERRTQAERQRQQEMRRQEEQQKEEEEERKKQEERQRREEKRRRQQEQQRKEERRQEEQKRLEEEMRKQEERQRREETRRRQQEQQRKEERKRQMEQQRAEERRKQEEQQRKEEKRRKQQEQQRTEERRRKQQERQQKEEKRRKEEQQWMEEEMRRQEERQRMEEEMRRQAEREWMEEEMRRQEERQRMEEEMRRQAEREWMEEEMRRQAEQQWMEEEMRRQEEQQWMEEEMRRQEERQRREEERRQEERERRAEERRRKEERERREEERRRQEERERREEERRRKEERERREEERRREERRERREEERRIQEERQRREEERRRQGERERIEEERRRQEERQRRVEEGRRQEERQRIEEERRRQLERQRMEEERRRQAEQQRMEEERKEAERQRRSEERRRQEEREKIEQEERKEEGRRRREQERRREEEQQAIKEERRRQEEGERMEQERRRQEERQKREDEKRRQEESQRVEQERRKEEGRQRREEERRREEEQQKIKEEWRRQEERERMEQEKRRQEERQKREEEKRRQEESQRAEQERRKEEGRQRREEERRREEEQQKIKAEMRMQRERERLEEERVRQEERQRREEERQEKLNQRLQESHEQSEEQLERRLGCDTSEEHESRQDVLVTHLAGFKGNCESGTDDLLQILSLKCRFPVPDISLAQLTADQLASILSVLDKLLFDEWIDTCPSLSTLQHTQVFITELCALSLEISCAASLQNISSHVQSLVESISQSALNVFESFLLTQALYLTLMHFDTDYGGCDTDAVLIGKQWAENELSTEQLFLIDFLSTLTSSLQKTVERATVYILKMEIKCLEALLSILTHLNGKETHSESTKILLRLVQTKQWTPVEALTLLKVLSQSNADDASITEILTLVQVYDISPEESGQFLLAALDSAGPERFHQDFQKNLRQKDESILAAALAELQTSFNLDDSAIDMINNITTGVLQYSTNAPKDALCRGESNKCATLNADDMQILLSELCKAVFDTKGWWPTVNQVLRWCALVLTAKNDMPQLFCVEEDPCVTAMFAATQVCRGNKLDIVLSSDIQSKVQTMEWSDFYDHLGISLNTNMKTSDASYKDIYEADIVYRTMGDFLSDYFQHGIDVMETGNRQTSRGLIIEEQCLSVSPNLELPTLNKNSSLVFAADVLKSLMGKFYNEDMELRRRCVKALFQVLHADLNKGTNADTKIIAISKKLTEKELSSSEVFTLTFLEKLFDKFTEETGSERNMSPTAAKYCLDVLFTCVEKIQATKGENKEVFRLVSHLEEQGLWTPVEALNLLRALTECHHDKDCISIRRLLHLMVTFQVSSKWTDESNQSLIALLGSLRTKKLIQHLEKSLCSEDVKSIDTLFEEIRQMKDIDEQTLSKSHSVVTHVTNLIKTGKIRKHKDVQRARNLSKSTNLEDLQELLAILCNAVHLTKAEGKFEFWPRATQMISWCFLALSDTGKLLEMGTGEGKSCVIAMFAGLRALRGEKVDVVSSSSVLCQRDAEEWNNFYKYFGITADTNTNKDTDKDRKQCYQKDVVYGTIEAFAADHLRQTFEMKDVRPDRRYQCIIVDEVDSLMLDQGVQMTYLSSPMVSMQHLNIILAMIWSHVSQYRFLSAGQQIFVCGPPASFFKAVFDSIDTEDSDINDPMDILQIAEELNTVPKGLTEDMYKSETDEQKNEKFEELLRKLKTVDKDAVVSFFHKLEDYIPYGFTVYTLDDKGLLCLRKRSMYDNQEVPELTFLVLEGGLCCPLYDSEETLIQPISELISEKIQYTPCENNKGKISIPGFLKNLVEKKVSMWVQNAFLALQLKEGQEYVVENNNVCPVDFRSTGIVELNKKWGDGLQQFVEIKHQIKLSTISTVTNYISNIAFFEQYHGKIYGTTGTLGSKTDILFLQELYPDLSACKLPTFNRKKLFEVEGTLKTSAEDWKAEIKRAIMAQISPNSYRGGRAALVICETINKAKEIYGELKGNIQGEIILYCRSDKDSLSKIDKELLPGDVIVATNLAGRGTDIKVSKQVNNNGGLFVILSFLSENTRVELQAFGRTARKGKPGSAQIIMSAEHLQPSFGTVSSLEEAKSTRDRLAAEKISYMKSDVAEMKLREDLFSEYLKTLKDIHEDTDGDEKSAVVAIMNEFWGIWLQTKSEEIDKLEINELHKSLKDDLSLAKSQSKNQTSPCSSIYHYIKFGNIALVEKQWDVSIKLFEKAMKQDESWAAIAFYNHAYCTVQQKGEDYLIKARDDLMKAQESLKYLNEECIVCLQLLKMSSANSAGRDPTSLEKQLTSKCSMLKYLDKNISEAIQKLDEIKERGRDAKVEKSPIFSLVSNADEDLQVEAKNLYSQGLKYAFSVNEEPRFAWEGLLTFFLGVLQIVGGGLLIAFTFGTFAQVGMGLITEGISDCIYGIESMVTGAFSWKSWAIEKAISIGVSLVGFGVGKLISKGSKACKMSMKAVGKQLKLMPTFLSRQVKEGASVVARANIRNAATHIAKKMVEQVAMYGLGKAEAELLKTVLNSIKNMVEDGIKKNVKSNMEKQPLARLVDSIILSHVEDKKQLHDLLKDKNKRSELLANFRKLSTTAVQPFYEDLGWKNKLNSSFLSVLDRAKAEANGTARGILTTIKLAHLGALAADGINAVISLSSEFFSNFHEELRAFKKRQGFPQNVMVNELSATDTEMLKEFRQDLAETISALLADAFVQVFHQKFSSHCVSYVQSKVNGVICHHVRTGLKSDRTEELLRAGQNNRYITHMPVDTDLKYKPTGEAGIHSRLHAEKITDTMTSGTLLDLRVLSETTGTKVVIQIEDSQGNRTKMQELNPSTKPHNQTVTLIYTPKSTGSPDGHYNVLINNQKVKVDGEGKNCLFLAMAHALKPTASKEEISSEAHHLRSVVADTLHRNPHQWEPFVKRKDWTESIRGGDWFMGEGGGPKKRKITEEKAMLEETIEILEQETGKVRLYIEWQKDCRERRGLGQFINGDHQPPVNSIMQAVERKNGKLIPKSELARAMLEVATKPFPLNSKEIELVATKHGLKLPVVYVPYEIHRDFLSTTSKEFRSSVGDAITGNDVVQTFKLTILGAMPRFRLDRNRSVQNFNSEESQTRLKIFENSFQDHSVRLVETWFNLLKGQTIASDNNNKCKGQAIMSETHRDTIIGWINKKGYNDPDDPCKMKVCDILKSNLRNNNDG